jgi:hypothetical protein
MWRRRILVGVLVLWLVVSLARLTRLVEPAEVPPGQDAAVAFDHFRSQIPSDGRYLFVLPGEFGADTGMGPRLRYELYPRVYDDVRASQDPRLVRDFMQQRGFRYIVVPDASAYPSGHWLRMPPDWLRRVDFDANRYVLEVVP